MAALRLSVTVEYLFVSIFLHLRFTLETEMCCVSVSRSGTANTNVSSHNTSSAAHSDIRLLINDLTERFNTLANSDDTELDQLKEIVDYIKKNKNLIEGVTTNKVNVFDIINNLTTDIANKPLSAAQGVVLKSLIDSLQLAVDAKVDTSTLSEHSNDAAVHVTVADRSNWNAAKSHASAAHAPADAEKNQNAFSTFTVNGTNISADSSTDTISIVSGNNIRLTADATNDKITIAAVFDTGTASTSGLTRLYAETGNNTDGAMTQGAITTALGNKENAGAAASALTSANNYTDNKIDDLISCGTTDPSTAITSKFYFKYSTE